MMGTRESVSSDGKYHSSFVYINIYTLPKRRDHHPG